MGDIYQQKCILSPSLISCCDLCNLEGSVKALERAGIEMLHVDILDGHFSPSMPLGLDHSSRFLCGGAVGYRCAAAGVPRRNGASHG